MYQQSGKKLVKQQYLIHVSSESCDWKRPGL